MKATLIYVLYISVTYGGIKTDDMLNTKMEFTNRAGCIASGGAKIREMINNREFPAYTTSAMGICIPEMELSE